MSAVDRSVRLLVAASIAVFVVTDRVGGTLAVVLGAVAVLSITTSVSGWCVLYALLGVSTRKDVHAATPKA